jgi:hypothetical protein
MPASILSRLSGCIAAAHFTTLLTCVNPRIQQHWFLRNLLLVSGMFGEVGGPGSLACAALHQYALINTSL